MLIPSKGFNDSPFSQERNDDVSRLFFRDPSKSLKLDEISSIESSGKKLLIEEDEHQLSPKFAENSGIIRGHISPKLN